VTERSIGKCYTAPRPDPQVVIPRSDADGWDHLTGLVSSLRTPRARGLDGHGSDAVWRSTAHEEVGSRNDSIRSARSLGLFRDPDPCRSLCPSRAAGRERR